MATLELRPRSATEIIDAAFQLLRTNYVPLVTLSVAANLPLLVVRILAGRAVANPAMMAGGAGSGLLVQVVVVALLAGILTIIAQSAVMVAASQAYLGGTVDAGAAIGRALRRTLPLILISIAGAVLVVLGFFALIIPGIYIALRLIPLNVVTVLEDVDPGDAFSRTWALGRGRVGHMFVTSLLGGLIYLVGFMVAGATVVLLASVIGAMADQNIAAVFTTAITALIYPLVITITVVLYYDLRIRHEGFDVEMMSRDLGAPAAR